MKLFTFLLLVIAASVFASGPSELGLCENTYTGTTAPESDAALLFSQTYSFGALLNGYRHIEMCDDFIIEGGDVYLEEIVIWMIYAGSQPTDYALRLAEDSGDSDPNNATVIWEETVSCSHIDTGDDNWGYDIYETTCTISSDAYPLLTGGTRYWLMLVFKGDEYWLVENPIFGNYAWTSDGTTWYRTDDPSTFAAAADAFFDLYGTRTALNRNTWGNIKSTF